MSSDKQQLLEDYPESVKDALAENEGVML